MSKRFLLFVEITAYEIRFLKQQRNLGSKSAGLSFQSIPFVTEDNQSAWDTYSGMSQASLTRLEQVLRDYRQKSVGNQKLAAFVLLPFEKGLIREYILPWIHKRDRDSAVEYCLKHEFPYLMKELIFKYRVIEERERQDLRIQVTAIRRDIVRLYAQCFDKAGYILKGIEYSAWALAEYLCPPDSSILLCLRKANLYEAELIVFKGTVPLIIRDIRIGAGKNSASNIFFGPQDLGAAVDFLLTDGSLESEKAVDWLKNFGLIGQVKTFMPPSAQFETYALLGARQRVRAQNNYNFLEENNHTKFKKAVFGAVICLILLLTAGGKVLYTQNSTYQKIQEDIASLVETSSRQTENNIYAVGEEWQEINQTSLKDLQQINKALGDISKINGSLVLTSWNYQKGKLTVAGECGHNNEIMQLMNIFVLEGWKQPVLVKYHRQREIITFTLNIQK